MTTSWFFDWIQTWRFHSLCLSQVTLEVGIAVHKLKAYYTLIETHSENLKMDGWKRLVSFWDGVFSGAKLILRRVYCLACSILLKKEVSASGMIGDQIFGLYGSHMQLQVTLLILDISYQTFGMMTFNDEWQACFPQHNHHHYYHHHHQLHDICNYCIMYKYINRHGTNLDDHISYMGPQT